MKKVANFMINKRIILLIIVLLIAGVSMVLSTKTKTNTDMTKYLSDDSNMKQGLDLMESDFPEEEEKASIRVMVDDLSSQEIVEIKYKLKEIPYVDTVTYESESEDYNKENHTLFRMNTAYGYDSEEERSIENALKNEFTDYQLVFENDDIKGGTVPLGLLLAAVGMALVILVLMSGSWLEPVLFMITIGIAIIINMGTNIVFPYTADLTGSIAPIIQLALSMDYSIILMSRYRQEKENHDNKIDAMKAALSKSITSIASSSITTIAGLLALVFLSFKLGPELGIVLAKGILISMLCVFTVLPVLILACDKGIEKTKKKSPHISMSGLAKFSFKARFVVSIVFVILFISFFLIQKNTGITFTEKAEDKVADVFPKDNQVVLIYENKDEGNIHKITSELEDDEHVKSLLYFTDTLGKECDAEEMSDTIGELVDDVDINKEIVSMLYYLKFNGEMPTITPGEFLDFLKNDVMTNDMLTEYMGTELMEQMNSFSEKIANDPNPDSKFMNAIMSDQKLDAKQMNELLLSFTEDISEKDIELMYLYYAGIHQANENWTMTIPALFHYLCETVMNDERFSGIFDEEMKTETLKGKEDMDDAIEQMQGEKYSRLIITTDYLEEASDTSAFVKKVDELRNSCLEKSSYLVGTSVMVYEMENTFTKEFTVITLITAIAIFMVVLLAFRNLVVPLLLTLLVQGGVFITVAVIGWQGGSMYYLSLLIVQSILMGATIDYGIVFCNYYEENRKRYDRKEALKATYGDSIHTIMTSGSILVLVLAVLGIFASSQVTSQVCTALSIGALVAVLLILIILPGMLTVFDKLIVKNKTCEDKDY